MLTMMGSINAYTKNLKLQTKFQMKQARGELGSRKSLEDYLQTAQTPGDEEHKSDDKLTGIKNKLLAGGKLTLEERNYLQSKDPEAYQKLTATEQEQKAFEQKLKQCRTKEEAQRLKMTYIGSSLVTLKSVEHNSAIPDNKKLEIFMQEKQRCDRIEESSREFVRRGDYDRLPNQAEEAKARKDAKEAKEAQRPKAPEKKEPAETAEEFRRRDTQAKAERKPAIHVETREEKKVKRAKKNVGRGAEAEYAQAVAAYRANTQPELDPPPTIDAKG